MTLWRGNNKDGNRERQTYQINNMQTEITPYNESLIDIGRKQRSKINPEDYCPLAQAIEQRPHLDHLPQTEHSLPPHGRLSVSLH